MSPKATPQARSSVASSISTRKKLLYGIITAVMVLGGVELGLHAMWGPSPPSDMVARLSQCEIRVDGTHSGLDCHPGEREDVSVTAAPEKPRVVFLGGSSVRESHDVSKVHNFPAMLGLRIPEIEAVNFGATGLTVANVARLASELEALSPDLVVIYSGHNDFNNDVFLGKIGGVKLWMIPVYQWLAKSWAYAALNRGSVPSAHKQRGRGGLIGTQDRTAFDVRSSVSSRLESDLRLAVRESPAPVLITTLLRNFSDRPAGVVLDDAPDCENTLPHLGVDGSSARGKWELAQRDCPGTSIAHWWAAQAYAAAGQRTQAVESWYASLSSDPVPLRAPPDADRVIRKVAAETGATLVDLEQQLGPMASSRYFVDTLHLSSAGAEAVATALLPHIETALSAVE